MIGIFDDTLPRRGLLMGGLVVADAMMLGGMLGTDDAEALDRPRVYTRKEWGARPPRRPTQVRRKGPDHIVIHHTASSNDVSTSLAHAFALSRNIQRFHMNTWNWDDIGEHLTISRGGYVMEGRSGTLRAIRADHLAVGAHSLHHNGNTLGIENEGTYTEAHVPGRLWRSLEDVCAWLCAAHDLDPIKAIVGHRDYNSTDCPGDALYRHLPELRRKVARRLDRSRRGRHRPSKGASS